MAKITRFKGFGHGRSFKIIRDKDYGFSDKGVIGINVQRIWKESKKEDVFIPEFSKTYTHELLHIIMEDLKLPDMSEEETIRAMLGEEWDSKLEKAYSG